MMGGRKLDGPALVQRRATQHTYYEKNKDRIKARRRENYALNKPVVVQQVGKWKRKNQAQARRYKKIHHLKKYGLTLECYEQMGVAQDGRCDICGEQPRGAEVLCVDHDHETSQIRALLCRRCNAAIGLMKEDPARLREAASYLENWKQAATSRG